MLGYMRLSENEKELIELMRSNRHEDFLAKVNMVLQKDMMGNRKTYLHGEERFVSQFAFLIGAIDCQG